MRLSRDAEAAIRLAQPPREGVKVKTYRPGSSHMFSALRTGVSSHNHILDTAAAFPLSLRVTGDLAVLQMTRFLQQQASKFKCPAVPHAAAFCPEETR